MQFLEVAIPLIFNLHLLWYNIFMTIDEILSCDEGQTFDFKSIKISPKDLAVTVVAFANADGGDIALGITDKKHEIEGINNYTKRLNELLQAPFKFCKPSAKTRTEKIPCKNMNGEDDFVLLMHIEPTSELHITQADEAYVRVGDKSNKLSFDERIQLMYDKGERYYEDKPVIDAELSNLDMDAVNDYIQKIGYSKSAMEYLTENNKFVVIENGKTKISTAAILLFGKYPQQFFPRAQVRFIRYEGTEEKVGAEMNVIKDVIFKGNILKMITDSIAYLETQVKERTYLGQDGLFVTEQEYPKFVRQEIIVNAVTHRDYSIKGTDIQIKLFDDHIAVESPGTLPGSVKVDNIRHTHFSRNPKIAEYLKAYKFVKEFGEGVDRMCRELLENNQPEPKYEAYDIYV